MSSRCRAAYSHSASVGSRNGTPVALDSFLRNFWTSLKVTLVTGAAGLSFGLGFEPMTAFQRAWDTSAVPMAYPSRIT